MKRVNILLMLMVGFVGKSPAVLASPADGTAETVNPALVEEAAPDPMMKFSQAVYDSLLAEWYTRTAASVMPCETFYRDFIDLDTDSTASCTSDTPDSIYETRLRNILSPIQLPYNEVIKRYLVAYTTTRKSIMESILERSQYYFPMIEEELCRVGLPLELRMLPAVESALNPMAVSRAGATGLWQFMYTTGKQYGLEVTSFMDQRRDPVLATQAACRLLADLYQFYGDWTLALAAYNCGPGNVNKAMRRAGENAKNYWDIYPYLPVETRGYIPSFIAATYAYTYHRQHGMEQRNSGLPSATDTVTVKRLMHFEQVASTIDVPIDMLRALNPQYKMDIIPAVDRPLPLVLPAGDVSSYLSCEGEILRKDSVYLSSYLNPANLDVTKKTFTVASQTYRVKSGDTLGGIAHKHGVTVSQLMKWNGLKSTKTTLRVGQRIEIFR